MTDVSLPDVQVRGWQLVLVTAHGIRVWWHQQKQQPWAAGLDDCLTTEARKYAMACFLAQQQSQPFPPLPETTDQIIPWSDFTGLVELDIATLDEGDPV